MIDAFLQALEATQEFRGVQEVAACRGSQRRRIRRRSDKEGARHRGTASEAEIGSAESRGMRPRAMHGSACLRRPKFSETGT